MKKSISIVLAVVLCLSSLFVTAYASDTKTQSFIDDVIDTKSICIEFDNDALNSYSIPFQDLKLYIKSFESEDSSTQLKVAATAKLWFFNVKLLMVDGEIYAYLPFVSFCVSDMLGGSIDFSALTGDFTEAFGGFTLQILECLKLKTAGDKVTDKYGEVYVEEFVPDIRKTLDMAVENGVIEIPEGSDFATMSDEEIREYLLTFGQQGRNVLRMLDSNATFYYDSEGKLIAFDIVLYDLIDDSAELSSNDLLPVKAESITSDVDDSVFEKPVTFFDLSSLFSVILGMLLA
ncbi:MAG: hypothetical protein IJA87_04275 [Clostridia bacterium]|nr:hypothetical protein [Clostridia bacterium]